MISGKTKLLGVLGDPVSHSLSPSIHNFTCERLGLEQVYLPLHFQGKSLDHLLQSLWDLGFVGINITVPYKEQVAALFPDSGVKAVNTLYRDAATDYWCCASTDGIGFLRSVERIGSFASFEQVVILGNGGAALAVAQTIRKAHPNLAIIVHRRNHSKDSLWRETLGSSEFFGFSADELIRSVAKKKTLLIQGTSAPVYGQNLSELNPALKVFDGVFTDLTYGYPCSLLDQAKVHGIPAQDGLGMLIEQAREAQKLWWGKTIAFDEINDHLKKLASS